MLFSASFLIVAVTTHLYDGQKSLPLDIEIYGYQLKAGQEK